MGKLEKVKHNHLLTTILKNLIFAIVMLAPFLAVASRVAYVTFNKNAKDSYSDVQEITNISNVSQLQNGKRYRYTNTSNIISTGATGSVSNNFIQYKDVKLIIPLSNDTNNSVILNSVKLGFYKTEGNTNFSLFYYDELNHSTTLSTGVGYYVIEFTLINSVNNLNYLSFYNYVALQELTQNNYLDNAFEYSVNQLNDMQIFNWTTNTAIYTPINSMCSGLGFTQNDNVIALLLTYWAINTAIYIIFDIVIACFTKLTHFVSSE